MVILISTCLLVVSRVPSYKFVAVYNIDCRRVSIDIIGRSKFLMQILVRISYQYMYGLKPFDQMVKSVSPV